MARHGCIGSLAIAVALALTSASCGVAYQAATQVRASRMRDSLRAGQSTIAIQRKWGEPDIRQNLSASSEVWSYAARANANDVVATVLYTSAKEGDSGRFLDLKFVDHKLVSWSEAEHTMPSKEGAGVSFGLVGGPQAGTVSHF